MISCNSYSSHSMISSWETSGAQFKSNTFIALTAYGGAWFQVRILCEVFQTQPQAVMGIAAGSSELVPQVGPGTQAVQRALQGAAGQAHPSRPLWVSGFLCQSPALPPPDQGPGRGSLLHVDVVPFHSYPFSFSPHPPPTGPGAFRSLLFRLLGHSALHSRSLALSCSTGKWDTRS